MQGILGSQSLVSINEWSELDSGRFSHEGIWVGP